MTSAVLLEGQIWSLYLQCEVVTDVHQTDTLLTHKCWKAITWLHLENIKTTHRVRQQSLHLMRPISLVTSCRLTYYINHSEISGWTHAGKAEGSDERCVYVCVCVCDIEWGPCTFWWSRTCFSFHSVKCARQQDIQYINPLVCGLHIFLNNYLKYEEG